MRAVLPQTMERLFPITRRGVAGSKGKGMESTRNLAEELHSTCGQWCKSTAVESTAINTKSPTTFFINTFHRTPASTARLTLLFLPSPLHFLLRNHHPTTTTLLPYPLPGENPISLFFPFLPHNLTFVYPSTTGRFPMSPSRSAPSSLAAMAVPSARRMSAARTSSPPRLSSLSTSTRRPPSARTCRCSSSPSASSFAST